MKRLILATLIATGIGAPALCMDPVVEKETVGTIISNRDFTKLQLLSEVTIEDIVLYYETADIRNDIEFLVELIERYQHRQDELRELIYSIPSFINIAIEVGGTDAASPSYQYRLGTLLRDINAQRYMKEVFSLTKLAADKGYWVAQTTLGEFYDKGINVEKNEKESFRYYKLASQQFFDSSFFLIPKYENGIGVEQDVLMAIGLTLATNYEVQSMMEKYIELVRDPAAIIDHNEPLSVDPSTDTAENLAQKELLIEDQLPVLTKILNEEIARFPSTSLRSQGNSRIVAIPP